MLAIKHGNSLCFIDKVILVFKLSPKLLAPLCHDSQNFRGFDDEMTASDLFGAESGDGFGYFSADLVLGVLLHLIFIFL